MRDKLKFLDEKIIWPFCEATLEARPWAAGVWGIVLIVILIVGYICTKNGG